MEFLTSAFVVAYHSFRWHNITLPRGQILHLLRRLRRDVRPDIRFFAPDLLAVWRQLLGILTTGENSRMHFNQVFQGFANMICPQSICSMKAGMHDRFKYEGFLFQECEPFTFPLLAPSVDAFLSCQAMCLGMSKLSSVASIPLRLYR
jgi:hypothetical protein